MVLAVLFRKRRREERQESSQYEYQQTAQAAAAALGTDIMMAAMQRRPRYTEGEKEILAKLDELKNLLSGVLPPYGRIGYIPPSVEDLAKLVDFEYVELDGYSYGNSEYAEGARRLLNVEGELVVVKLGDKYYYKIVSGGKTLLAVGRQFLDYLSLRYLQDMLNYM